jgi:hypothetical protein
MDDFVTFQILSFFSPSFYIYEHIQEEVFLFAPPCEEFQSRGSEFPIPSWIVKMWKRILMYCNVGLCKLQAWWSSII